MAYTHLLAALGSPDEDEILLARAQALSRRLGARLSILHVVDAVTPVPSMDAGLGMGVSGNDMAMTDQLLVTDIHIDHARQRLNALCAKLGLPPENAHVGVGPQASEILSVAEKNGADLIVVGHHPHHGLSALFNHTETSVVNRTHCDVLVITLTAAAPDSQG